MATEKLAEYLSERDLDTLPGGQSNATWSDTGDDKLLRFENFRRHYQAMLKERQQAQQEDQQEWTSAIVSRLCELLALNEGWDGYQGQPLKHETGMFALQILNDVMSGSTPIPQAVPVATGGVQFEWHEPEYEIEFYVAAPYSCEVWYENHATGESDEVELTSDFEIFAQKISDLTKLRTQRNQ